MHTPTNLTEGSRRKKCQDEKSVNSQFKKKGQKWFTGVSKERSLPWGTMGPRQRCLLLLSKKKKKQKRTRTL